VRNMFLVLAMAGAVLAYPAIAADGKPQPGYWEVTNTASLLFSSKKVERRCLVASEISKFMTGPSNRHYKCTYPVRDNVDGKINLRGSCTTKKGQVAKITATGTYSPTSFKLNASLSTKIGGIPLAGTATTDAKRLGDKCPSDSLMSDEAKGALAGGDTPQ
jgi:Protein of unknown function (DUF3617)